MTPIKLTELEKLCAKATLGPWKKHGRAILQPEGHSVTPVVASDHGVCRDVDADFIATSREALPTLISAYRRLRDITLRGSHEDIGATRDELDKLVEVGDDQPTNQ